MQNKKPVVIGLLGILGLSVLYLVVLTLAESFSHALTQLVEMGHWIAILVIGFGFQLGLYTYIRVHLRKRRSAATAEVAASGGISTGAMIACCAHHLVEILPLIGLSAAALFLVKYQLPFIFIGIFSNLVGIAMMLIVIQKNDLFPQKKIFTNLFAYNMYKVRNITLIFSVVAIASAFLFVALKPADQDSVGKRHVHNLPVVMNDENRVSIEVKPIDIQFTEPLHFEIAINTHQGDLSFDLTEVSLLEDDRGNVVKPIRWEGSPPGGHHRSGTLIFPAIGEQTRSIKLIIKDVYDVPERIFEWELL